MLVIIVIWNSYIQGIKAFLNLFHYTINNNNMNFQGMQKN